MTELQSIDFVQTEIVPRTWRLTDANVTDWCRAVKRVPTIEQCRAIVLGIVDDPRIERLTLREFQIRSRGAAPRHKNNALMESYDGYLRCVEPPASHPEWAGREWVTIIPGAICTRSREAGEYVSRLAAEIQAREGGRWRGVLAITSGVSSDGLCGGAALRAAEEAILGGPDTPGRRFLQRIGRTTTSDQAARARELATVAVQGVVS